MRKIVLVLSVLLLFLGFTNTAFAVPITFFGQDNSYQGILNSNQAETSFLAALTGGYATENFDSFSVGASGPLTLNFGAIGTATLTGVGSISDVNEISIGRWPTSNLNYWDTSTDFTIVFNQPVYAFGFYATDIGDGGGSLNLSLSSGDVLNVNNLVPAVSGNALFFGFYESDINKAFTSVSFKGATNADWFGFDDMTVGLFNTPVPEPATMLLFGIGLMGLAGISARRNKL